MRTNQQSLTSKVRENFRKQLRKKELERHFAEHRLNWQRQAEKNEKDEFNKIYPNICEDNYQEHLPFLLHYSTNPNYNFMLVPLAGYVYEALITDPANEQPLLILETLSQYQEIDLPQTEQFAQVLVGYLPQRSKSALNVIANLVEQSRYCQELRDLLLDAGLLQRGKEMVSYLLEHGLVSEESQTAVALFFCCCCQFIKSHPPVPFEVFLDITGTLSSLLAGQEERFMLFQALESISSTFHPNFNIADRLFRLFQQVTIQEYHNYQHQIIQFVNYCLRSGIYMPSMLQQLLADSLESHSATITSKALTIFQLQIKHFEQFERRQIYLEMKELRLMQKLRNLFIVSKTDVQMECMECLQLLTRCIVIDDDPEQSNRLTVIIIMALQHQHIDIPTKALHILLTVLKTVSDEQLHYSSILTSLQREGIEHKIHSLTTPNEEMSSLIEGILHFLP